MDVTWSVAIDWFGDRRPEENEEIVNDFLAKHPACTLGDPLPQLPPSASKLVSADRFLRTFPDEPSMDGFFAARIVMTQ